MCLIIQRPAGADLSFEDFKTSIRNNPDGYGLSYGDTHGNLQVVRNPSEPDPEVLYRTVQEELKDTDVMIHLRYTTAGETTLRNAHPFPILEKSKDGVDLRMAHNGTIHSWKPRVPSDESDTRNFVRGYVRPLFKRLKRGYDIEEMVSDKFLLDTLLSGEIPSSSVLTFMTGEGTFFRINEFGNGGFIDDKGVYFSNKYSFNPSHRSSNSVVQYPTGSTVKAEPLSSGSESFFCAKKGIKNPKDLLKMDDDTIDAVVKEPNLAKDLIKELLFQFGKVQRLLDIRNKGVH